MSYKAIGTLHSVVGETLQITTKSGNPFQRRELTIKQERYNPQTGEVYTPNYLQFELTQQHCSLADQYAYGTMLEVSFSIEGSLYNDRNTGQERTFNRLRAFAIAPYTPPTAQPAPQQPAPQPQQPAPQQWQPAPQQPQSQQGQPQQGQLPLSAPTAPPQQHFNEDLPF